MRYERVQDILENEKAFKNKLSARTVPVETRFNEKVYFSEQTISVTQALHANGRDAHKVPKTEVLMMAAKVFNVIPNGQGAMPKAVLPAAETRTASPEDKTPATPEPKKKAQAAVKPKTQQKAASKPKKPEPEASTASKFSSKSKALAPQKAEESPEEPAQKPQKENSPKAARTKAPEKKSETPKSKSNGVPKAICATTEDSIPESELPPEKQPLRLPPNFDPRNHPHYSVQSSIYSLLLSALAMSEAFEKFPGAEKRQAKLSSFVKEYQDTCDPLKQLENAEQA